MNRLLTIIFSISFLTSANAQFNKVERMHKLAQYEMKQLRFAYAIPIYKNYLSKVPKDTTALRDLAIAYQKVNQFDSSLQYYLKAKNAGLKLNANIAELYANIGDYEHARAIYQILVDSNKTKVAEARLYGFNHLNKLTADSLDYKIYNTKLNTVYNDFNAALYKNGVVFESNRINVKSKSKKISKKELRKTEFAWDGAGYSKLFYAPNSDSIRTDTVLSSLWIDKQLPYKFSDYSNLTPNDTKKPLRSYGIKISSFNPKGVQSFDAFLSDKMNVGAVSFTEDGRKAYYTRNQKKSRGVYQLEIWEATNINGKWVNAHKMFFNNPNFSYFHPAITQDGKRLYYVSDESTGFGGTDIYMIDQQPDGSWKNTVNLGQDINTANNELFPTVYDNSLYISSNGQPGLGGLDIYQIQIAKRGEVTLKNLGYPINSSKDDFAFSVKESKGFFSTNRFGSDDILAYDFNKYFIKMSGKLFIDSNCVAGKKVFIYQKNEGAKSVLVDSTIIDTNCNYTFNVRPNKQYELVAFDAAGKRFAKELFSDDYTKNSVGHIKQVELINIPIAEKELQQKNAVAKIIRDAEVAKFSKSFAKTVDSLKALTKSYVELHHPFDQVFIVEKDLPDYYKVIEMVKRVKNKKIIIVSAADCNGSIEYNEDLSERRSKRIYKTLSKLSDNEVIIKPVGERELLKACDDLRKSKDENLVNRYSYVFIIDKNK